MKLSQSLIQKGVTLCADGHIHFEVTTLGLTGEEWHTRLTKGGHISFDSAKGILPKPDFDQNHRYAPGQTLKVFLVRGTEIKKDADRTTKNLQAFAKKHGGKESVSHLKAELALLIREKFTNEELEEMGLWYIAVLHNPFVDAVGDPRVLLADRYGGASWVNAYWDEPGDKWEGFGAFAFAPQLSSRSLTSSDF